MPLRINGDADQIYQSLSRSGTFTVKSAYIHMTPIIPSENTRIQDAIWKWKCPQKICTFMWYFVHNRLKTHWELYKRHIIDEMNYLRCEHNVEDALHALHDCLFAKNVWVALVPQRFQHDFFSLHLCDRLMCSMQNSQHIDHHLDWLCILEWRLGNYGVGGINLFMVPSLVARLIWYKILSSSVKKFEGLTQHYSAKVWIKLRLGSYGNLLLGHGLSLIRMGL